MARFLMRNIITNDVFLFSWSTRFGDTNHGYPRLLKLRITILRWWTAKPMEIGVFTKIIDAISCLNTHRRLCMPETIADPISFLLNMLPTRAFVPSSIALSWTWRWPVICSILHELDQLQHYTTIPCKTPHGQKLIEWLRQFN
jgi:hypothetical protein